MELRKEAVSVPMAKASEDSSLSSSSKGKSKQENITSFDVETEDTLSSSEYQFTTLENSKLTEKESCSDAQTQNETLITEEPNTPVDKNEMVKEKKKEEISNAKDERPNDGTQTLISSPVVSSMRENISSLRFEIWFKSQNFEILAEISISVSEMLSWSWWCTRRGASPETWCSWRKGGRGQVVKFSCQGSPCQG